MNKIKKNWSVKVVHIDDDDDYTDNDSCVLGVDCYAVYKKSKIDSREKSSVYHIKDLTSSVSLNLVYIFPYCQVRPACTSVERYFDLLLYILKWDSDDSSSYRFTHVWNKPGIPVTNVA
jgi:hypothetical protein